MRLQTFALLALGLSVSLSSTSALADCIGEASDAPRARAATPRVAPSAAVVRAPVLPSMRYDYERTVEMAVCSGAFAANDPKSYFFNATISMNDFTQAFWPYASRIFRVDPIIVRLS